MWVCESKKKKKEVIPGSGSVNHDDVNYVKEASKNLIWLTYFAVTEKVRRSECVRERGRERRQLKLE